MTKLLITLGLTLAASTGAFARSNALDAYVPQASKATTIDYTATASVGGASQDKIVYHRAGNDGSPTFLAPSTGGIDFTATASVGGASQDKIIYHRAGNDGSPTFAR